MARIDPPKIIRRGHVGANVLDGSWTNLYAITTAVSLLGVWTSSGPFFHREVGDTRENHNQSLGYLEPAAVGGGPQTIDDEAVEFGSG